MKQTSNSRTTRAVPPTERARPQGLLASALIVLGAGGLACLHFANANRSHPAAPDTMSPNAIAAETKPHEIPARKRSTMPGREVRAAAATSLALSMEATSASGPSDPVKVRQSISSLV